MLAAAAPASSAVVIGGGLLGLEAANGLARNGMDTTVLHLMPTLMERQLDPVSAGLLKADLTARGITVITEAQHAMHPRRTTGSRRGAGGRHAICRPTSWSWPSASGPTSRWRRQAGLACGRGIQVDDGMRTSDPAIYAVGECVEHRGALFGLVAPLYDMAKVARRPGHPDRRHASYVPAVTGTRLKVTGIDMFSAGDFTGDETTDDIVFRDAARGVHKKLVIRDDKLIGAVLYGEASDSAWYFDLIRNGTDISAIRDTLVFGPARVPAAPTRRRRGAAGHSRDLRLQRRAARAPSWPPSPSTS